MGSEIRNFREEDILGWVPYNSETLNPTRNLRRAGEITLVKRQQYPRDASGELETKGAVAEWGFLVAKGMIAFGNGRSPHIARRSEVGVISIKTSTMRVQPGLRRCRRRFLQQRYQ